MPPNITRIPQTLFMYLVVFEFSVQLRYCCTFLVNVPAKTMTNACPKENAMSKLLAKIISVEDT